MISNMSGFRFFLALLVSGTVALGSIAQAQDLSLVDPGAGGGTVCAAVWPCADDGSLMPEYSVGDCSLIYSLQCSSFQVKQTSYDLQACSAQNQQLLDQIGNLQKQVRQMRRTLFLQRLGAVRRTTTARGN